MTDQMPPSRVVGYVRVSTDTQDVAAQETDILMYAKARGWPRPEIIRETISAGVPLPQRLVFDLTQGLMPGDAVCVTEISRLARSTIEVLQIMQAIVEHGAALHVVRGGMSLDGGIHSRVILTVLGLAADIERELIRERTRRALAARKAAGQPLGRPRGPTSTSKLDKDEATIRHMHRAGVSVAALARIYGVARGTMTRFLRLRGLKTSHRTTPLDMEV